MDLTLILQLCWWKEDNMLSTSSIPYNQSEQKTMHLPLHCSLNLGNVDLSWVLWFVACQKYLPLAFLYSALEIFCICSQSSSILTELLQTVSLNLLWSAMFVKSSYPYQPMLLLIHSFLLPPCVLWNPLFIHHYSSFNLLSQRRIKQGYLVYPFCWSRRKFTTFRFTHSSWVIIVWYLL